MDERFIYHRLIATRVSVLAGVIMLAALFFYALWTRQEIRWDYFSVLLVMTVAKLLTILYLRVFK